MAMKVLVAADDASQRQSIARAFGEQGHTVITVTDGHQALMAWATEAPDLVLLEVDLPAPDGLQVCRRIRQAAPTPIIFVSRRDAEEDVLRGLAAGADDYVVTPFKPRELVARARAVLRRARPPATLPRRRPPLRVGDLLLDPRTRQASLGKRRATLTEAEFRILYRLAADAGEVVPLASLDCLNPAGPRPERTP
jgi:DNA-binding response OmpR family regulator